MSADKNAVKAELNRVKSVVPVLIVVNVVLGLAFVVALAFAMSGSGATTETTASSISARRELDPLAAQADALIAGLHCPCAGCGHSKFSKCDGRCGERVVVRDFVLQHLRSGTDAVTVLAHVKDRFGDLTTIAGAKTAWSSMQPEANSSTSLPTEGIEELPPDLMRLLEQDQDGT